MIVDLFIPCFIDQLYPSTAWSTVKLLERLNIGVNYNADQTCCGQIAFNAGHWDEARVLGEKLMQEFQGTRYVVSPSASCAHMIRDQYHELFYNTALHNEYKSLEKRVFELSDFLVNVLGVRDVNAGFHAKVTYHHACTASRQYGLKNEPVELLENVRNLEYVTMDRYDECCGFGGTFAVKHEPISVAMTQQKVKHALDTGAEYITSTEASCLMQMESYIRKQKLNIKTIHLANILNT